MMQQIRVWDWPLRLTHWGMVVLVVLCYGTGRFGWLDKAWHFRFGYALLALVLFRLLWGVFGPRHARWWDLPLAPGRVWRHLLSLGARVPSGYLGHNPLGSLSLLALLGLLLAQIGTGLFSSDDIFHFGPLSGLVASATVRQMTRWHASLQDVLLIFIALHVAAIAYYELWKRERLLVPMFSGRKPVTQSAAAEQDAQPRPLWFAVLLMLLACAAVWGLLEWAAAGAPAW